ncbi:hypothetical protein BGZ81_004774 [Podila clonocystis]|nr:hypothetical protein BGZ81_004774 [Podila clonocystis]
MEQYPPISKASQRLPTTTRQARQSATESDLSPTGASVSSTKIPSGAFDFLNRVSSGKPLSSLSRNPVPQSATESNKSPARDSVPSAKVPSSTLWLDFLHKISSGTSTNASPAPSDVRPTRENREVASVTLAEDSSPTYNVLFLGESQSGKSTLIEFLKCYADPEYTISRLNLGDGIFPCTKNVLRSTIRTNLPTNFVTDKAGDRVDYGKFLENDQEDYEDELNERKAYQMLREKSTSEMVTFNLYDTPGLNDFFDDENIAIIFKALEKEKVPSINLVVITVANNPFTEGLQNTLKAYVNLLPDLNGNIVFLHTRIDYSKVHPEDKVFSASLAERQRILHDIMGRDTVPHILIDNDIDSKRTIRNCITLNKLRELLSMAKLNLPVPVLTMTMNKTMKMQMVDNILKDKFETIIAEREATFGVKDQTQKAAPPNIGNLKAKIVKYEQALQDIERDQSFHARDKLFLIHEERQVTTAPGFFSHAIDHIDTQAHNVHILSQEGGNGDNIWGVQLRRTRFQHGLFHVKIYIQKRKMFATEIEACKARELETKAVLADLKVTVQELEAAGHDTPEEIQVILDELVEWRSLLGRVSSKQLDFRTFLYMLNEHLYVREDSESAVNVERFFKENRTELEELDLQASKFIAVERDSETTVTSDSGAALNQVFEEEARKKVKERMEAEALREAEERALAEKLAATNLSSEKLADDSRYTVLVFGKTQAGKSTFIEFVRNYADPAYAIDDNLLGTGITSKTREPTQFDVISNLPGYEAFDSTGNGIDKNAIAEKCPELDAFLDTVNNRKSELKPSSQEFSSRLKRTKITFLDTPGIEDTNGQDIVHAPKIIGEMVKMQSLNLIIVIVNCKEAPSKSHQLAFDYYSKVIQVLQGSLSNVVFVYTHVNYEQCHHSEVDFYTQMKMRHKAFSKLFRGSGHVDEKESFSSAVIQDEDVDLFPMYTVDLDRRYRKRPVKQYMSLLAIREILELAVASSPLPLDTSAENLDRTSRITHPDALNNQEREKILAPMCASFEGKKDGQGKAIKVDNEGDDECSYGDKGQHPSGNFNKAESECKDESDYKEYFHNTNNAIISKALESIESINLIVITVSNNPFTEGLMAALKVYLDLLPEFNGNFVFVHVMIGYSKLHPDTTLSSSKL